MRCRNLISLYKKLFIALVCILLPGLLRADPVVPNIEVTLNGTYTITSGSCPNYTAKVDLTVCNGYATFDQQASSDINTGVCQADGTCSVSQKSPAESYDCTLTSDGSGSCENTYSSCTYDVVFTATGTAGIPLCETRSAFPSSTHSRDPVNTSTGELYFVDGYDLYLTGGPRPLSFVRYYASHLVVGGYGDSHLGNNWAHNFSWRLDNRTSIASVNTPQGRIIKFSKSGSGWSLSETYDAPFQLVENSGEFTFLDPRVGLLYIFDDNNGGRLVRIENGKGSVFALTYDNNNLLSTVSDGLGRTLAFSYGPGDRMASVSDGARTVSFSYDADNLDLTSVTDALGKVTTYSYDPVLPGQGKMLSKTLPRGNAPYTQTYINFVQGKPLNGRVFSQTDALENRYRFSYPTAGGAGTVGIANPESNAPKHTYNSTDRTIDSITDETGDAYTMDYDANGRRTSITDRLGDTTTYTYHAASGKIASVSNADNTTTTYTYTSRTHSSGVVFYNLTGMTYPDNTTASFGYDSSGNITSHTNQAGKVSSFTYNSNGQILTITNPLTGVTTHTYNSDGTLATRTDPAGNITTYGYDSLKRLILVTRADDSNRALTYDNNDNILSATDENGSTITDPLNKTTTLAYDNMNRLLSVTDPLGKASSRTYDNMERLKTITDRNGTPLVLPTIVAAG